MKSSESDATRTSLIARAKERDSQAWCDIVDLYGPLIAHWSIRCGCSTEQAADQVQEVLAAVSRSIASFQPRRTHGAFRAWLWTITSNKIRDMHRRKQNQVLGQGGSTAMAKLEQFPERELVPDTEPTDAAQLNALITRGLAQVRAEFEPRTWDMFRRTVIDQIATSVVAEEFRVSSAAVRQARSRVLRRLRQQLGDLDSN